jgi:hypothetical protein
MFDVLRRSREETGLVIFVHGRLVYFGLIRGELKVYKDN